MRRAIFETVEATRRRGMKGTKERRYVTTSGEQQERRGCGRWRCHDRRARRERKRLMRTLSVQTTALPVRDAILRNILAEAELWIALRLLLDAQRSAEWQRSGEVRRMQPCGVPRRSSPCTLRRRQHSAYAQ